MIKIREYPVFNADEIRRLYSEDGCCGLTK